MGFCLFELVSDFDIRVSHFSSDSQEVVNDGEHAVGDDDGDDAADRAAQEAKERAQALELQQEIQRMQRELARERQALEARIALLRSEFEAREDSLERSISQAQSRKDVLAEERVEIARLRKADEADPPTQQP